MLAKAKSPPIIEIERKKLFKRRFKLISLVFFLILFLVFAIYAVLFSGLFVVQAIEVNGNESASNDEIIEVAKEAALRNKWFYELAGSKNILFWKDIYLTELPRSLPQISSIRVKKSLGDNKIIIDVVERNKFAIWCEKDCFWMDEQGVVFAEAPETQGAIINIVRVSSERKLSFGDKPIPQTETQVFAEIINFLDEAGLAVADMKIEDLRFQEINVEVLNGPEIKFSLGINPFFGRTVVESLRKSGNWEKIEYLDLRVDGRAYYKLK